jgi:hypothetical protein
MNHSFPTTLLAFSFVALTSACSGATSPATGPGSDGGGGGGGDSGPVVDAGPSGDAGSAAQACADSARARCQRYDACSNGLYTTIHWGDESTCETNTTAICLTNLAAPGTAASAATVEACASAIPTESCADFFGVNPPAACAALAGTLAAGAACLTSSQCQSTYCAVPSNAACGVCAAVPKAGDACAVEADCGSRGGLTCAQGACVAFGAASASCGKGAPCGIGLSCVGEKKTTPGACQPAASTVGATCDSKQQTGPGCDGTLQLSCDPATSQCVLDTVVTASATCGQVGGGVAKCATSGTCVLSTSDGGAEDGGADAGAAPITGACLAAAANGAACDTASGPACVPSAKCVTASDASTAGTCTVPTTCQ